MLDTLSGVPARSAAAAGMAGTGVCAGLSDVVGPI